jgi:CubicO group peptidase (beta-lactamase class C family)
MRRIAALLVTLATIAGVPSNAQAPQSPFSAVRLARVDRTLQQYVDDNRMAGAVALVLRDGQPVYERAVGWSDKENGRKMTNDTIFRIASQTKAITSTAVLMLVEEGKLGLAEPVSHYIPSFSTTTVAVRNDTGVAIVPAKRAITIRDLLTHTSGISYGTDSQVASLYEAKGLGPAAGLGWYTADKAESICNTMERLGTLPFVAQPGEAWVYGYNTDVLGCVVERASGMPLDEFIRTHITGPLGMKDTQFFLPASQGARLAAVYGNGAGLLSTARDYARFLEMIRNGGALGTVRLLAPRTVDLMTSNQVGTLHSSTGLGFGLGFETTDRYGANGMDAVGSFGWGGAYGTVYRVDPQAHLVIVLMIQLLPNTTDIREKFPTLVYQALTGASVAGADTLAGR